jgi:signal transduction histidine kinase
LKIYPSGVGLKLGTKLTLYLSLMIVFVLSGYGYFHILSRREILVKKMKSEVESTGRNLKVSLEKVRIEKGREYVQDLIDGIEEYEKTLAVIVYHEEKDLVIRSRSLEEGTGPYLELVKKAMQADLPQEEFGVYKETPIFVYAFPLKDKDGKPVGGVSILQYTSFMEEDIKTAEWNILITVLILIGGVVAMVLLGTRKWISQPISHLIVGINHIAKGNLDTRINLRRKDEISQLAEAFNQMAVGLKKAQEELIQQAETRVELERNLRQSEKLATIGQLASGLAHEIGTPLNIISGRVELAKRRLEDGEAQKHLDIVMQQTERITKIIQHLLGFVRKKKPEQRNLNLGDVLDTALDFLDHPIQKQRVTVMKEIQDHLPLVPGDPDQLQQVFLNLILNAIQAMPGGGTLRLSASSKWISKEGLEDSPRQYVEIGVKDSGIGMEKTVTQTIFQPFYTTKNTGTGLGLTVSQGIVQDHEGWIEVESERGKGSVFRVYLPSMPGEAQGNG